MKRIGLAIIGATLVAGCGRPDYDLSTPEAAIDAAKQMVHDGNADMLVELIHLAPRDISFEDGVTEASAISDVKAKLADLLAKLWTIGTLLQAQFPGEVLEETNLIEVLGNNGDGSGDWQEVLGGVLASPFGFINEHRDRIETIDLGDGTAAVLYDGEPAFGGLLAMEEIDGTWQLVIPTHLVQDSEYWPQTRWEWAVVASMLLSIENGLGEFETEVREKRFRSLSHASERAGRFIGESVIVQGIIYAYMKRGEDDA